MATEPLYQRPINVRGNQMELSHDSFAGQSALSNDFEGKLGDTQVRLAQLEAEREKLERQARECSELNDKKKVFLSSQVEMSEKLSNAVTLIDRELVAIRTELQHLEECRDAFDGNLKKIAKFDPESWSQENVKANLDQAIMIMDNADDQYDQAATYFATMRSGSIFGKSGKKTIHAETGEFLTQLKNGLAFNLPIITLGCVALVIYLLK
jgi:chromosome segregation ATPase